MKFQTQSPSQDVLGQMFRSGENIEKLMAIDAGEYYDEFGNPQAKIYYMGNIYTDARGITKFVRHFSLIFR